MEKPVIPTVYPVQNGMYVTVPSESWNSLVTVINDIVNTVNAQSEAISKLIDSTSSDIDDIRNTLKTHDINMAKIAEILEELYETLE